MISHVKTGTLWIRFVAGNMIGGLIYSQFQNLKTALYNQTKLRILIMHEKRKVLGLSFLVGGVHKLRPNYFLKNLELTRCYIYSYVIFGHPLLGSLTPGPFSFHA
jgi:hypothetical protein